MSFPLINPTSQFFDSSGSPLSSGTIEFRDPTTNNLIDSYPTADDADAQTNANDNPLTLSARGEATNGLYLEDGVKYKIILKDSTGTTIWTQDDVRCPIFSQASIGEKLYPQTSAESSAGVTPTNYFREPGNVLRYGADPTGAVGSSTAIQAAIDSGPQKVYFPAGTYLIDAQLNLGSTTPGIEFSGVSYAPDSDDNVLSLLKLGFDGVMFDVDGGGSLNRLGIHWTDLQFEGDAGTRIEGTWIYWRNQARRGAMTRCYVEGFYDYGIRCESAGGLTIRDCEIFNNGYNIYGSAMADSYVYGGQSGSGAGGGSAWVNEANIWLTAASGNTHFIGHRPNFAAGFGVKLDGNVTRCSFVGGLCDQNLLGGFLLDGACTAISIIGMDIFDNGVSTDDVDTITDITQADPAVVTATNTLTDGQPVTISGVSGMTEVNGETYIVANATGTTFELLGLDSTGFTAYTSGGSATSANATGITITSSQAATGFQGRAGISIVGNKIFDRNNGQSGEKQSIGIYMERGGSVTDIAIVGNSLTEIATPIYKEANLASKDGIRISSNVGVDRDFAEQTGTVAWDPASIDDGNEEAKDITVAGAALGDFVLVALDQDLQDCILSGSVTATNTVTAVIANNTGGAIDIASGNVSARIIR